jgi:hypothetical protein
MRTNPEIAVLIPFEIVGAAGKIDRVSVRKLLGRIGGIPRVKIEPF